MHEPMPLAERSLSDLLGAAVAARVEGLVVLRCRGGLRHGFWVEQGFVVGAHVAGEHDPLLERLRRRGALDGATYRTCLEALQDSDQRAGSLALAAGVEATSLRDALAAQLTERALALLTLAEREGHDAWFEARPVPAREASVRMPLGSLWRRVELARCDRSKDGDSDAARRKRLRELARRFHPDLHAHRDGAEQRACERALARATAAYHGFRPVA